jgi:hypothetical protein
LTSLAPPGADEARRGKRSGRKKSSIAAAAARRFLRAPQAVLQGTRKQVCTNCFAKFKKSPVCSIKQRRREPASFLLYLASYTVLDAAFSKVSLTRRIYGGFPTREPPRKQNLSARKRSSGGEPQENKSVFLSKFKVFTKKGFVFFDKRLQNVTGYVIIKNNSKK